jgi:anaerobic C4-dicarboxylate transporter
MTPWKTGGLAIICVVRIAWLLETIDARATVL